MNCVTQKKGAEIEITPRLIHYFIKTHYID